MVRRKTKERETRLVAEYLAEKVFPHWYRQRQPLGPPLPGTREELGLDKALRVSRPWRPEVDAVAVEDGRLVLIEGKVFKYVDGMAKLPLYKSLVATTPELANHREKPVVMRLLMPWRSETVDLMVQAAGIELEVFSPPWIRDYVEDYQQYWTKEYREAREERQRLRAAFGLE